MSRRPQRTALGFALRDHLVTFMTVWSSRDWCDLQACYLTSR